MSITKTRDLNIELLRIISIILILVLHTDLIFFDDRDIVNTSAEPISSFIRIFIELISFGAVNIFVFISGWYGIRFRLNRLFELCFQVFFFLIISYLIHLIFNSQVYFSWKFLVHLFLLNGYWFFTCYLMLYIFSPVLNKYIENTSEKEFRILLILFYLFQTVYGWIEYSIKWFADGSSPISFIGLYLLASYIRLYCNRLYEQSNKWIFLIFFLIIMLLMSGIVFYGIDNDKPFIIQRVLLNLSPFYVLMAVSVFLFFKQLKIKWNGILFFSSSCFAAYLFHTAPNTFNFYVEKIIYFHLKYPKEIFIFIYIGYIFGFFLISIIFDKCRILVWKLIEQRFYKT